MSEHVARRVGGALGVRPFPVIMARAEDYADKDSTGFAPCMNGAARRHRPHCGRRFEGMGTWS